MHAHAYQYTQSYPCANKSNQHKTVQKCRTTITPKVEEEMPELRVRLAIALAQQYIRLGNIISAMQALEEAEKESKTVGIAPKAFQSAVHHYAGMCHAAEVCMFLCVRCVYFVCYL